MARRRNTDEALGEIGLIRANNNWLWMQILAIALEAEPKKTREVIKEIRTNDEEVSKWLGKL